MKATDVRNLSSSELEERLRSLREELFNVRFRLVTQQVENPIRIRSVRRDIARVLTVMREREGSAKPARGARAGGK